jgi:hypothetical protein
MFCTYICLHFQSIQSRSMQFHIQTLTNKYTGKILIWLRILSWGLSWNWTSELEMTKNEVKCQMHASDALQGNAHGWKRWNLHDSGHQAFKLTKQVWPLRRQNTKQMFENNIFRMLFTEIILLGLLIFFNFNREN